MDKQIEEIKISQKAIRQSAKKEGVFVELLNQEMKELQDSQKQIEEMVGDIAKVLSGVLGSEIVNLAYFLDEQGYRKIPENAVVLRREDYEKLIALKDDYVKGYEAGVDEGWEHGSEETAEKFVEMLKDQNEFFLTADEQGNMQYVDFAVWIDEIAKEITEGKE